MQCELVARCCAVILSQSTTPSHAKPDQIIDELANQTVRRMREDDIIVGAANDAKTIGGKYRKNSHSEARSYEWHC